MQIYGDVEPIVSNVSNIAHCDMKEERSNIVNFRLFLDVARRKDGHADHADGHAIPVICAVIDVEQGGTTE